MMRPFAARSRVVVVLLLSTAASVALAQAPGGISGRAIDPWDGVLPGTTITATSSDQSTQSIVQGDGTFTVAGLRRGL
jgi:hypothetical protein